MEKKIEKAFMIPKGSRRVVILYIIFLVVGGIILFVTSESQWNKMTETYQLVDTESEIEGVVLDIYQQQFTFVDLNNKTYLRFKPLRNYTYQEFSFSSFIQVGDSLYKNASSDTLFVFKNEKKYFFVVK